MDAPWIEWEGAAARAVEEAKVAAPVSAYELARGLGLRIIAGPVPGARLNPTQRLIELNPRARKVRRHGLIAHEVGHFVLQRDGEDSEAGASYVGSACMLPRLDIDRDIRRTAWSLLKLRDLHPNASAEMIARRIVELRDAVVTIIDGRTVRRVASPWLTDPRLRRTSRWERDLAERALEIGEEVRGDELCYAVPFIDGPWRRVIVVCEAEQLALRL